MAAMRHALVVLLALAAGCATPTRSTRQVTTTPMTVLVLRLLPGDDPKRELEQLVKARHLEGAVVLGCAGSLTRAVIRFADRNDSTTLDEKLEIVSLGGTIAADGASHLHVSVSTKDGRTLGGHLKEGSLVYTTAEITLGIPEGVRLVREKDERTGYPELFVEER
jgi:predicted DNA-binding protein with PD1-like motif